jgi:hypothetical protein
MTQRMRPLNRHLIGPQVPWPRVASRRRHMTDDLRPVSLRAPIRIAAQTVTRALPPGRPALWLVEIPPFHADLLTGHEPGRARLLSSRDKVGEEAARREPCPTAPWSMKSRRSPEPANSLRRCPWPCLGLASGLLLPLLPADTNTLRRVEFHEPHASTQRGIASECHAPPIPGHRQS